MLQQCHVSAFSQKNHPCISKSETEIIIPIAFKVGAKSRMWNQEPVLDTPEIEMLRLKRKKTMANPGPWTNTSLPGVTIVPTFWLFRSNPRAHHPNYCHLSFLSFLSIIAITSYIVLSEKVIGRKLTRLSLAKLYHISSTRIFAISSHLFILATIDIHETRVLQALITILITIDHHRFYNPSMYCYDLITILQTFYNLWRSSILRIQTAHLFAITQPEKFDPHSWWFISPLVSIKTTQLFVA